MDHKARFIDFFYRHSQIKTWFSYTSNIKSFQRCDYIAKIKLGNNKNWRCDISKLIVANLRYISDKNFLVHWLGIQLLRLYDEFDFKHSSTYMIVEHSFWILNWMWRIFKIVLQFLIWKKILAWYWHIVCFTI